MLDAVSSLQTNVIATVRRERADLPQANNGNSDQARRQSTPFVLAGTPAPPVRAANPLDEQIAELISVAQAAAQTAGGIEPKALQASAYGRASAAYERMSSYASQAFMAQPLLSLTI